MHDYGPLHSIVGLNKSQSLYGQEFLTQKAPDKSLGTNMRHESVSPHSVAGPRQLVPLNIAQSDYEQALGPKKDSDTSLGAQTRTGPCVPSCSEDESSHPILINTAQNVYERELNVIDNPKDPLNSERECNSNVWIPETIELVIQKLQDITNTGWQLKSEYDDCIKVLNAKLREQDSLIDQLKDHTAVLMQVPLQKFINSMMTFHFT